MKKIFLIPLLLLGFVASAQNIGADGKLKPLGDYPLIDLQHISGGYHIYLDTSETPNYLRIDSATVVLQLTDTTAYLYTDAAWIPVAGGSGTLGSVAWANITGVPAGFADGVDNVNDADNSITNEIQTMTSNEDTIFLSGGGGFFVVPVPDFYKVINNTTRPDGYYIGADAFRVYDTSGYEFYTPVDGNFAADGTFYLNGSDAVQITTSNTGRLARIKTTANTAGVGYEGLIEIDLTTREDNTVSYSGTWYMDSRRGITYGLSLPNNYQDNSLVPRSYIASMIGDSISGIPTATPNWNQVLGATTRDGSSYFPTNNFWVKDSAQVKLYSTNDMELKSDAQIYLNSTNNFVQSSVNNPSYSGLVAARVSEYDDGTDDYRGKFRVEAVTDSAGTTTGLLYGIEYNTYEGLFYWNGPNPHNRGNNWIPNWGTVTSVLDDSLNGYWKKSDTTDFLATKSNIANFITSEVDGSVTNELQTIDVYSLSENVLSLSLSSDGQATKTVTFADWDTDVNDDVVALEDLSDVRSFSQAVDDILQYTGTGWNAVGPYTFLNNFITGNEPAFEGWDKDSTNDRRVEYVLLTGNRQGLASDAGKIIVNLTTFNYQYTLPDIDSLDLLKHSIEFFAPNTGEIRVVPYAGDVLKNTENVTISSDTITIGGFVRRSASGVATMVSGADLAASYVTVTPSGNLVSTDAQAALLELQSDIDALASGAADGVSTSGSLDVGNQEIDVLVSSPGTNFSINLASLGTLVQFTNWDKDVNDDFSGDYNDLTNKPSFVGWDQNAADDFSGDYNDLTNLPSFTGWDADASDDFSGDYNDLINKPSFTGWDTDVSDDFDGAYSSLSGIPSTFMPDTFSIATRRYVDSSLALITDDQTATEVPFTPYSTLAATNVQAAIQELLDESGGTDDQVASEVPFTPYSTLAATNVQSAIQELLDEGGGASPDSSWNSITVTNEALIDSLKVTGGYLSLDGAAGYYGNGIDYVGSEIRIKQSGSIIAQFDNTSINFNRNTSFSTNAVQIGQMTFNGSTNAIYRSSWTNNKIDFSEGAQAIGGARNLIFQSGADGYTYNGSIINRIGTNSNGDIDALVVDSTGINATNVNLVDGGYFYLDGYGGANYFRQNGTTTEWWNQGVKKVEIGTNFNVNTTSAFTGAMSITNGTITLSSGYNVQWAGGNNRIQGAAGGVGGGGIDIYTGARMQAEFAAESFGSIKLHDDVTIDSTFTVTGVATFSGATSGISYTDLSNTAHTHTQADIIDLEHYTDSDIDGTEVAFTGWDKNVADDFSGAYADLTGKPTLTLDAITTTGSSTNNNITVGEITAQEFKSPTTQLTTTSYTVMSEDKGHKFWSVSQDCVVSFPTTLDTDAGLTMGDKFSIVDYGSANLKIDYNSGVTFLDYAGNSMIYGADFQVYDVILEFTGVADTYKIIGIYEAPAP